MKIRIKQIDSFTSLPLSGNPAGVVQAADALTDQQMQAIAREVGASETAFILSPSTPAANLRIRWFTPQEEVGLCGHATVAAFHALAEDGSMGMANQGTFAFQMETKSGILPVTVDKDTEGAVVFLGLPVPEFIRAGQFKLDVMRILNIQMEEFENHLPIVVAENLYVPVRRLHTIFSMKPNIYAMTQFLANRHLPGLCVFTTETIEKTSSVHSRFFAPTAGIVEDPVTGSSNGPLAAYLFERGLIETKGPMITLIAEQGDVIGRKGRVTVRLVLEGERITAIKVGGRAVTVLDSELRIQ
jgi:trans-2,3-dihydro-3-hydroxyanthranilate isomerase